MLIMRNQNKRGCVRQYSNTPRSTWLILEPHWAALTSIISPDANSDGPMPGKCLTTKFPRFIIHRKNRDRFTIRRSIEQPRSDIKCISERKTSSMQSGKKVFITGRRLEEGMNNRQQGGNKTNQPVDPSPGKKYRSLFKETVNNMQRCGRGRIAAGLRDGQAFSNVTHPRMTGDD